MTNPIANFACRWQRAPMVSCACASMLGEDRFDTAVHAVITAGSFNVQTVDYLRKNLAGHEKFK